MTKPELLAPAGSWEAFLAGLEAGADAFYLGLKDWSARGRAKNFTLDELRRLVPLAHAQGRRVYAALNTLVTEEEVPRALDALWELGCLGIDAVILQDLGLWAACREAYPELRLHASTQLSVHSSAGARQLERMGFSRVVLARECTVPEIGAIQKATALPLEVFVHGALCYSVSGQCLASSALTGRSANRGWCAQVCRWGFRKPGDDPESHPFSPSDLSLVGRVWDLAEAGVSALKIEGRLKGADYVHAVVRAYRKVLDAPPTDRAGALGAALEILKSAATRPATEGYAYHPRPVEVLKRGGRPGVGADVGRVHRWKDGSLTMAATQDLKRGDRIRIQSGPKGEGVALVLRSFHREKVPGGLRVSLECPQRVNRGDRVYRVKDARGEELEQRLARELKSLPAETGLPVRLRVAVDGAEVRVAACCGPAEAEVRHAVPQFPAERRPLDYTTLKKHLGRLGETPYRLEGFAVEGELPPVVIPPSALKEVRNAVVDALDRARVAEAARRRDRAAALRAAPAPAPAGDKRLWIRVESPRVLWTAAARPCHRLVVAMTRDCLRARDRLVETLGGRDKVAWELPVWIPEGDLHLYRERLQALADEGYREVVATNLAHLDLVEGLGLTLHAGWPLHALNGWAAAGLRGLGCRTFSPSPEAGRAELAALAGGGWPLPPVVYAYGSLPLFLTRLDPAVTWPEGEPAETVAGAALRWSAAPRPLGQDSARVYGPEPLCWSQHIGELRALGATDFLFDLGARAYGEKEAALVLEKFRAERELARTGELNWHRGLR